MMARYTEVCQQPVNLLHTIVAHPVAKIAEVAPDKGETLVVDDVPLCILILIEAEETALRTKMPEDLTTVPTATEGHVHINAVGLDVKPANALLKEYWNVICLGCRYHRSVSAFMIFSNSRLKSSSVRNVF